MALFHRNRTVPQESSVVPDPPANKPEVGDSSRVVPETKKSTSVTANSGSTPQRVEFVRVDAELWPYRRPTALEQAPGVQKMLKDTAVRPRYCSSSGGNGGGNPCKGSEPVLHTHQGEVKRGERCQAFISASLQGDFTRSSG